MDGGVEQGGGAARVVGGVGWLVLRLLSAQGSSVPSVGWFSSVVILLASGVVLAEGYQVKKLQSGTAGPPAAKGMTKRSGLLG